MIMGVFLIGCGLCATLISHQQIWVIIGIVLGIVYQLSKDHNDRTGGRPPDPNQGW